MLKLILRQEAIDDLNGIWAYTSQVWSEQQADKYYQNMRAAFKEIADGSVIKRKYDTIADGLLGYKTGKHIILYHIIDNEVEIVRVLHERMDLKNKLIE